MESSRQSHARRHLKYSEFIHEQLSAWRAGAKFRAISDSGGGFSMHLSWTAGCEQSYIHRVTRAARTDKGAIVMFKRARHQFGWLEKRKRKRGPEVWVWRYHEDACGRKGKKPAVVVGDVRQFPTKSEAWEAAEGIRLGVGKPVQSDLVTFGALINRFLREALPERKGTADRYRSWILNHINPRWEAVPLSKIKPLAVELWLKGLNLAPKSKGHVRSVMHILFEWAMRWELMEYNRNPMSL